MAKKSMLEREKKREKMVAKYAKLRAELKAKGDYEALSAVGQRISGSSAQPLQSNRPSSRLYA